MINERMKLIVAHRTLVHAFLHLMRFGVRTEPVEMKAAGFVCLKAVELAVNHGLPGHHCASCPKTISGTVTQ